MYVRRRVGRRRSFFRKHRVLTLLLLGAVACLASFLVTQQLRSPSERVLLAPQKSIPPLESKQQLQPAKNERFVYPYSVIPGGVQSREELTSVIGSDPIVAEHYARFAVSQAKIIHAADPQFVHVAYRLRNKVYWTAKTLKIPKGETLITDGTETARTRCGNRVSAVPLEPVAEAEPAIEMFEVPVLARVEAPEFEMPPRGLESHNAPTLPPFIPLQRPTILPYYYRPLFVVSPHDVVVPEPATLGLLSIGLAAFLAIRFARKK
jgi:hypothetical protein